MAFPTGLPTRQVSFGSAVILEDGTPLRMVVEIQADRSLTWKPTGQPLVSYGRTFSAEEGTERTMPLPVTDAEGYVNPDTRQPVDVSDGKQSHSYSGRVVYYLGIKEIKRASFGPFVLPVGDGSVVDIDTIIPFTGPTGVTFSIPDQWTDLVERAEAAAAEAAAGVAIPAAFIGSEIGRTGSPAEEAVAAKQLAGLTNPTPQREAVDSRVAARKVVTASRIESGGHSYMHGSSTSAAGSTIGVGDMQTLTAKNLDLPTRNLAVSGATLHDAASAGDWGDWLQAVNPGTAFTPVGGAASMMWGLNDWAQVGSSVAPMFASALALVVARKRCAAVFEDTDTSVAFGGSGSWTQYSGTGRNSGSGCRYTNTNGATVTITLPAAFPGGTITLGFPVWGDGSSCTWSTTVNGVTYSVDTSLVARTGNHPTVAYLRITNVRRNNAPIVLTVSNVSASGGAKAVFDWWGWEPAEEACPVIALVGQPKPLDYTSQASAPAGPVGDAGVDEINATIQAVAASFGDRVAYVDTSYIDKNLRGTFWEAGNVHPNAAGHAYIAEQVAAKLKGMATISPGGAAPASAEATSGALAYTPTFDGTGTALGDGTAAGKFSTASDGTRSADFVITVGATTTIGATTFVGLPGNEQNGTIQIGQIEAYIMRATGTNPGTYPIRGYLASATGKVILRQQALDANGRVQSISATAPLALTVGDKIYGSLTYRPA